MRTALTIPPATCHPSGTTQVQLTACVTSKGGCSTKVAKPCVGTSNVPVAALDKAITMSAQVAVMLTTEPKTALADSMWSACRQSRALTPYNVNGWRELLIALNISHKHPNLIDQLMHSFLAWAPTITCSFTPPNNPSICAHHDAFNEIVQKEFTKQQYIGPFTQDRLKSLIGPFQPSPLNIIPKAGKPGKFCLIQNLSHPNSPQPSELLSINSQVNPALFPCEWGKFNTACALVQNLP